MQDRLVELLKTFELCARVFQAGPLCLTAEFYDDPALGYIHLVKNGSVRVESPKHSPLLIEEPSVFFYMNPVNHRLIPVGENLQTVCASLEFGAGVGNPLAQGLPDVMLIRLSDMPSLDLALQLLFHEVQDVHCGQQAILDRLMEIIFIQLLRDAMNQKRVQVGLLAGLADSKLAKALNAMHKDPAHRWSLEQLAAISGMSRARFAAHFHKVVGLTPGNYLNEWRLTIAQKLLQQGKPVQWIADSLNYSSVSALSRSFRGHTGCSPTEWVQRFRERAHTE